MCLCVFVVFSYPLCEYTLHACNTFYTLQNDCIYFPAGMKRRADDQTYWDFPTKVPEIDYDSVCDLIALGLEWSVTDSELLEYFQQFGKVSFAEVGYCTQNIPT